MTLSRGGDYRDKKTIYSIPEPEKTTAWKESDLPKEAPIAMVDPEFESAQRRTEEIKKLMSPPGALGLPPLLEAARLKWGIPDAGFASQAVFDRIHIFPIDLEGQKETYGNGPLYRADITKQRDLQNGHRGVLISMGLTAADHCVSHGIELGHIVRTIRNAPHVQECARILGRPMHMLIMRDGDLTGSETLQEDLRAGRVSIVDEGGDFSYCHNIEGRKKKSALIRDNW
jgi:hypothetical protein